MRHPCWIEGVGLGFRVARGLGFVLITEGEVAGFLGGVLARVRFGVIGVLVRLGDWGAAGERKGDADVPGKHLDRPRRRNVKRDPNQLARICYNTKKLPIS